MKLLSYHNQTKNSTISLAYILVAIILLCEKFKENLNGYIKYLELTCRRNWVSLLQVDVEYRKCIFSPDDIKLPQELMQSNPILGYIAGNS
eukprot:snap_masked-scaffold_35-processed-gene-1.16-mRNA-1 protein AED:1.00 eAED:1.00 QI:0/-1/0/0/-1/1/1/0/90